MDKSIWEDCQKCQALVTEFEKVLIRCGRLQLQSPSSENQARRPECSKTPGATDLDTAPKQRKKQMILFFSFDGNGVIVVSPTQMDTLFPKLT